MHLRRVAWDPKTSIWLPFTTGGGRPDLDFLRIGRNEDDCFKQTDKRLTGKSVAAEQAYRKLPLRKGILVRSLRVRVQQKWNFSISAYGRLCINYQILSTIFGTNFLVFKIGTNSFGKFLRCPDATPELSTARSNILEKDHSYSGTRDSLLTSQRRNRYTR